MQALQVSLRQAEFAQVLLLSDEPPVQPDPAITWRRIDRLGSSSDYSRFMLRELAEHVSTTHALCIQWDGFVLSGSSWDPAFLKYDYIGAPWPHFGDGHNVGNGGFSLRSRRLLDACRLLPWNGEEAEDIVIGRIERPRLEAQGIAFAPERVARRFAFERTPATGSEFGFHGAFNLVAYLPPGEALKLFSRLEPGMLSRSECLELGRWAILRGRYRLAKTMLGRWLRSRKQASAVVRNAL
jgi:hypothetical protein